MPTLDISHDAFDGRGGGYQDVFKFVQDLPQCVSHGEEFVLPRQVQTGQYSVRVATFYS